MLTHVSQFVKADGITPGPLEYDPLIMDDRYLAVRVKDRGVVVFSSCSHAGVVNVTKDVVETGQQTCFAVMGGYHLVQGVEDKIEDTVDEMVHLLGKFRQVIIH